MSFGKIVINTSLLIAMLCMGDAYTAEPENRNPREYFFTHSFGDLPEETQLARDEGKIGMLLFFEAAECPYCQHMLKNVFSQRSVQEWYAPRFVSIAVDIHGDIELKGFDGLTLPSKTFSERHDIFLTPVILFLDLNGVELYRHLGMVKTAEEFLLLGKYIEDKRYFDTGYNVFLKSLGKKNSSRRSTTSRSTGDAT